jgi:hypothetical protein
MHKHNITRIVKHGTEADMHKMKELFDSVICDIKTFDYNKYLCYEYELQRLAYDGHMSEELAEIWVSNMRNKDGTCGAHWTIEQVKAVMKERNIILDVNDFYATLNMIYSDYYNPKWETLTYIEMAKDWLNDSDIGGSKILKYYYFVVLAKE